MCCKSQSYDLFASSPNSVSAALISLSISLTSCADRCGRRCADRDGIPLRQISDRANGDAEQFGKCGGGDRLGPEGHFSTDGDPITGRAIRRISRHGTHGVGWGRAGKRPKSGSFVKDAAPVGSGGVGSGWIDADIIAAKAAASLLA